MLLFLFILHFYH